MGNRHFLLIAAADVNGVIGHEGTMPWNLPSDLRWFYHQTFGKVVVMGGRTWDDLQASGLDLGGREVIAFRGASPYLTAVRAVAAANRGTPILAGGAYTYAQLLPFTCSAVITRVHGEFEGDAFLPSLAGFKLVATHDVAPHPRDTHATTRELWISRR